ncbi:MAG: hypothetical protein FWE59_01785 [Oscillospiraceae bacterium]|nr:hypothetical protein [Oscillospiraceae bacterium]
MKRTKRTVFCGLMAAMALLFLYLGALIPAARFGLCAVAGLPVSAAVLRHGAAAGFLTWAASSALAFLLSPAFGATLLYASVFGLYAPLKGIIERLRPLPLAWLCKLSFAGAMAALFVVAMRGFLAESITLPEWGAPLLIAAAVAIFAAYDLALSRLLGAIGKIVARPHPP